MENEVLQESFEVAHNGLSVYAKNAWRIEYSQYSLNIIVRRSTMIYEFFSKPTMGTHVGRCVEA